MHESYHALEGCRDDHPHWLERGVYQAIIDVAAEMQPEGSVWAQTLP
ncbi:MAG: hypothetical protein ACT4TC_24425 [Myxococcaceae bacterium]